jgi:hypothetical protein
MKACGTHRKLTISQNNENAKKKKIWNKTPLDFSLLLSKINIRSNGNLDTMRCPQLNVV